MTPTCCYCGDPMEPIEGASRDRRLYCSRAHQISAGRKRRNARLRRGNPVVTDRANGQRAYRGPRPFALEPLVVALGSPGDGAVGALVCKGAKDSETARQWIVRAKRTGLTLEQADEWAVAVGLHPSSVWPDWYELTALAEDEREVAS